MSSSAVWAYARYELPQFQGATSYVITDDSFEEMYTTNLMPGTRAPIKGYWNPTKMRGWVAPKDSQGNEIKIPPIPDDLVSITIPRTVRTIRVTQLRLGRPSPATLPPGLATPDGFFDGIGGTTSPQTRVSYVNDNIWQGLPKGYWRITGYSSQVSKYDGYYSTVMTAYTKNDEDHSVFAIPVNRLTGKPALVSDEAMAEAAGGEYQYGFKPYNGVTRIGPYRTTDFRALFGFD